MTDAEVEAVAKRIGQFLEHLPVSDRTHAAKIAIERLDAYRAENGIDLKELVANSAALEEILTTCDYAESDRESYNSLHINDIRRVVEEHRARLSGESEKS